MTEIKKWVQDKDLILANIQSRGPILPVHIARSINVSPLFASAYLSELYGESKLKMSHMRVGSSPIYYLPGQEEKLEDYIQHLNQKEREAFNLLKQEKILQDEKMLPAIRVALRAIKDFATPLRANVENEVKIVWKYHLLSDDEAKHRIQQLLLPPKKPTQETLPSQSTLIKKAKETSLQETLQKTQSVPTPKIEKKKKPKLQDLEFANRIKEYLTAKEIEVLSLNPLKKKECAAHIRIDTLLGKQEFFLLVKDKKKITADDLTIALHAAQQEKMPSLVMSPGSPDKEAQEYLRLWRNLIKFEVLKL